MENKLYPETGQCKNTGKSGEVEKVDPLNREGKEECSHPVCSRNRKTGMLKYLGCNRTLALRYHKVCNQIFPGFELSRVKAMYKPSCTTKKPQKKQKQKNPTNSSFCGNVIPFLILLNHNSVSQQLKQSFHSNM